MSWQLVAGLAGGATGGKIVDFLMGAYRARKEVPIVSAQTAVQGFSELVESITRNLVQPLERELADVRTEVDRCKAQHSECEKNTARLRQEVAKLRLRVYELEREGPSRSGSFSGDDDRREEDVDGKQVE